MKIFARRRKGAPALEWLDDVSGRAARITSLGSSMLLVENHCGIRSFSAEKISLGTRCGCLDVEGRGLYLTQVRPGALVIRGSIAHVQLPCEGTDVHEP